MRQSGIGRNRAAGVLLIQGLLGASAALASSTPQFSAAARLSLVLSDPAAAQECASPEILALSGRSQDEAIALLAVPPSLSDERVWKAPGGTTIIHYTTLAGSPDAIPATDRNGDSVPDLVATVFGAFNATFEAAAVAGFAHPAAGRPVDVYLANLEGRAGGYVVPVPGLSSGTSLVVLDARGGDDASLGAISSHMAAHVVLNGYSTVASPGWAEATAVWLEVLARHDAARYAPAAARLLRDPERGLFEIIEQDGRAAWLWASFLADSSGGRTDALRLSWELLAANPSRPIADITAEALSRTGRELPAVLREFTLWNLFTGTRDDGRHYAFGFLLPDPQPAAAHDRYPALAIGTGRPIAPFGWSVVRFEPDGEPGGITVRFEGEQDGGWEADLLIRTRHSPTGLVRVPLRIDALGRAALSAPWDDASEISLLVRRFSTDATARRFSYIARTDTAFPFELTSLAAEPDGGQIRLTWETASEHGLVAWEVQRASERGRFQRVSDLPIPALGLEDGPVSYQFVDDGISPGVIYQYFVLGLTSDGLTQRSFVVTTRAGGPDDNPRPGPGRHQDIAGSLRRPVRSTP